MVDQLPGEMSLPTRDEERARYVRYYKLRVPNADTGEGSQAEVDAAINADMLMPIYMRAKIIGDNSVFEEASGEALDQWAEREGVEGRLSDIGASGYVSVTTSAGGGTVQAGDELVHEESQQIFYALETKFLTNGKQCAVIGKSTGLATNLDPGIVLKWTSPRAGIGPTATVVAQSDGSGLSGGREKESDDAFHERIRTAKRTRAASGNDAEYQDEVLRTKNVAVQQAFTYPAILGTGVQCTVFTMRPARPGASKVPTALQIALVEAHVVGEMPGDDGALFGALIEEPANLVYGIEWASGAWADVAPWPQYFEESPVSGPGAVVVSSATSATSFVLKTANDTYTPVPQAPVAGNTIGFYDAANFTIVRKRILSVTGTGPWTVTVDTTNDVSDTAYTPQVGQRAMPWGDGLPSLLTGIFAYFDKLGPGEQVAAFYDAGRRQRRSPRPSNTAWPSTLTTRGLVDAITSELVSDVTPFEGDGLAPTPGVAGVSSNILKLSSVAFFPDNN